MKQWKGLITYGEHSMMGTVYHQKPELKESILGNWYGFGKAENMWPAELLGANLETNIGTILINKLSIDGKDIEFQGSGPIKGPLSQAMGFEE